MDPIELYATWAQLTPEEQDRANRIATLIGPANGAACGSGLELLIRAEGVAAAREDVNAMIDSIARLLGLQVRPD